MARGLHRVPLAMPWKVLLATLLALGASAFVITTEAPVEDPVWWYTNQTPPRVSIQGPGGPLRGPVDAAIRIEPAERANLIAVTLDGAPVPVSGARVQVDSTTLGDGPHRLVATARDTSMRQNEAQAEWRFVSDNTGPSLEVSYEPPEGPTEGRTFLVRVKAGEPVEGLKGSFEGRDLRLQPDGTGGYWAVEGVPPEPAYRTMRLRLEGRDALGNAGAWERTLPLQRTRFPQEVLDFDPSIDYLADAQIRAEEDARLMPVYRQPNGEKRWSGPFRVPTAGPTTTEFATRRSYNGRFPQGNHAGLDIGAPQGAPVRATADGVVVLAINSPVRGNVLILDHGAGVYSTYAHMAGFEAEPGDEVKAGDLVGRVGSTGLSTGPHLHWEVWVDAANVDPLEWTQRAFP